MSLGEIRVNGLSVDWHLVISQAYQNGVISELIFKGFDSFVRGEVWTASNITLTEMKKIEFQHGFRFGYLLSVLDYTLWSTILNWDPEVSHIKFNSQNPTLTVGSDISFGLIQRGFILGWICATENLFSISIQSRPYEGGSREILSEGGATKSIISLKEYSISLDNIIHADYNFSSSLIIPRNSDLVTGVIKSSDKSLILYGSSSLYLSAGIQIVPRIYFRAVNTTNSVDSAADSVEGAHYLFTSMNLFKNNIDGNLGFPTISFTFNGTYQDADSKWRRVCSNPAIDENFETFMIYNISMNSNKDLNFSIKKEKNSTLATFARSILDSTSILGINRSFIYNVAVPSNPFRASGFDTNEQFSAVILEDVERSFILKAINDAFQGRL